MKPERIFDNFAENRMTESDYYFQRNIPTELTRNVKELVRNCGTTLCFSSFNTSEHFSPDKLEKHLFQ